MKCAVIKQQYFRFRELHLYFVREKLRKLQSDVSGNYVKGLYLLICAFKIEWKSTFTSMFHMLPFNPQFKQATKLYKKEGDFVLASECCEMVNDYAQAVNILFQAKKFEKAIDVLERYHTLSFDESQQREGVVPPKATHTMERLCFHLADEHYKNHRISDMEAVLARLPSASDRIEFLKKRGFVDAVARALEEAGKSEEAAQLLVVHGKFEEAARLSSEPKLVAECFMALARTTVQQKPNDKETVLEYLKTARIKYDEARDTNGQGEALLLIGKVLGDLRTVEEAGRKFNSSKNDVGQVETVEAIFQLTNDKVPKFPKWIIVKTISRLFTLLTMLAKPTIQLTSACFKIIDTCEKHFGLLKSSGSQDHRSFLQTSGSRFAILARDLTTQETAAQVMIPVVDARQRILTSLVERAEKLVSRTRRLLQISLAQNTICSSYRAGFSCDDTNCKTQHSQDTLQLFNVRFDALVNLVYLDEVVDNFVITVTPTKVTKPLTERLTSIDVKEYKSCKQLYALIFPDHGMLDVRLSSGQVVELRKNFFVKERLFKFAKSLWLKAKQRRTNVNVFIQVSSTLQLVCRESKTKEWLYDEERAFAKEAKKNKKVDLFRHGMVEEPERTVSFFNWWEDGKMLLHVHGDLKNSAHLFIRRFLSLPGKRPSVPFPSIANTVMILEHQLAACLMMCSRLNVTRREPICLPESYLRAMEVWNYVNCTSFRHYDLFNAVDYNARESHRGLFTEMQRLLKYMVELTCGVRSSGFDVVYDSFSASFDGGFVVSGEAERTLVLVLTMLCNCGKDIPEDCERVILGSLVKINPRQLLPERVKDALKSLKALEGVADVVKVLMKLLQTRGETLYDCRWNTRVTKLDANETTNPMIYSVKFNFDVSKLVADIEHSRSEEGQENPKELETQTSSREDLEDTEVEIETAVPLEYQAAEQRKRENANRQAAATKIQRWYRWTKFLPKGLLFIHFMQHEKQEMSQAEDRSTDPNFQSVEEHFRRFRVDKSACGVCGEDFVAATESREFAEQSFDTSLPEYSGKFLGIVCTEYLYCYFISRLDTNELTKNAIRFSYICRIKSAAEEHGPCAQCETRGKFSKF